MRRTLSLTFVLLLVACLSTACAHPLSTLRVDTLRRNGLVAKYVPPPDDTARCRAAVARLEHVALLLKIPVTYTDVADFGIANYDLRTIVIEQTLTSCGRLETLAHELAHLNQPRGLTAPEAQVYADGVSYLVVRALGGYDPRDRYAAYLAYYKPSMRVFDVLRAEIESVTALLVRGGVDLR